ncbi:MAG: SIS domain-containing protein [Kosmotoga sp.]|nr:MAG: SIS domain-containing protein [Kosmotoga sp.]
MITENEILEQPSMFQKCISEYKNLVSSVKEDLLRKKYSEIGFVGCGSSYYLAMGLAFNIARLSKGRIKTKAYTGSELAFDLNKINEGSLLIGISRSGESTETLYALKKTKSTTNATTIAVTCTPNSKLEEEADHSISMNFINEESIVMTKSFTSMAFIISVLFQDILDNGYLDYSEMIFNSSKIILDKMHNEIEIDIKNIDHFVFLGYDEYFAASMEGLIKVTEMSLSEVNSFPTLEFRHGPKSKVNDKTLSVILPNPVMLQKEIEIADELSKLGANVLIISPKKTNNFKYVAFPYGRDDFSDWFLRVIPLQLLGLKKAVSKGLNPDSPKNLGKVVKF